MGWPTAVATDTELFVAVNNTANLLSAGINSIVTTIPVIDTSAFPSDGYISINGEIIKYSSKDATNFLGATRGADGSTPAAHLISDTVHHRNIAAHHNVFKEELKALETDIFNSISADLDDSISPIAIAATLKARLDHLATAHKNSTGESDWKTTPAKTISDNATDIGINISNIGLKVTKAGDTMSGILAMGVNKITGLAAGTVAGDAVRFENKGQILQVIIGTSTTSFSTTSTSFVATNLSVTITPKSTSSRILIFAMSTIQNLETANTISYASIYEGANALGPTDGLARLNSDLIGLNMAVPVSMIAIHSPATTSPRTYTVRTKIGGSSNAVIWGLNANQGQTIVAIEIES